jgi:hypothetical protein
LPPTEKLVFSKARKKTLMVGYQENRAKHNSAGKIRA